jgi:photosystem II stability/assembly factor-like uncharacterized protein
MRTQRHSLEAFQGLLWGAWLLTIASHAGAGPNTWTTGGPVVGLVGGLASDASGSGVVYAGVSDAALRGGFFRSMDGGVTWGARALTDQTLTAIASGPSSTVYAGTYAGAVFKSLDGGTNWAQIVPADPSVAITTMRVDPLAPASVYRAESQRIAPGAPLGFFFHSADGGMTWARADAGTGNGAVRALALDSLKSGTLYAAKETGLFKSANSGATWRQVGGGLPLVTSLAVDPFTSTTVYAGTVLGFYKSNDGGLSFAASSTGLSANFLTDIAPDRAHSGRLFAGTQSNGVFVSLDGGASWNAMNAGLTNLAVYVLAVDPTGNLLHAGTGGGVFDIQISGPANEILTGVVPVVIAAPGAFGSFFRTAGQLRQPIDSTLGPPTVGRLVFHPQGAVGSPTDPSFPFSSQPGSVLAIPDVLAAIGQTGLGSLDILISAGPGPVGTLRVFNDAGAAGTYGFSEDMLSPSEALNAGDHAILIGPSDLTQFRWNIGVRTLSAGARVLLTVRNAQGTLTRTAARSFDPDVMLQATADAFIVDDLPSGPQQPLTANDSLSIQVTAGNAYVYGTIADNRTNDPSFQLARKLP